MNKTIIFIDGPQGSGKSTVESFLWKKYSGLFRSLSAHGEINTVGFPVIIEVSTAIQRFLDDERDEILIVSNLKKMHPLFFQFLVSSQSPEANCLTIDTTDFWGKYQGSIEEQCEALLNEAKASQMIGEQAVVYGVVTGVTSSGKLSLL